jgi:Domain of unknown function (DUF4386)
MPDPAETSPRALARLGGLLYLIIIVAGLFGEAFSRGRIIVSGDAAATASNLRSSEFLWRLGIAGNLLHLVCAVVLTVIIYILLRPVGRDLALLSAFFDLVSIGLEAISKLPLLAALFLLGNAEYLKAIDPRQLQALAYVSIRLHGQGFGLSLIFFGCGCLVRGVLLFRSGYLPKFLGILLPIAGLCYLTNSFALLLAPKIADLLFPAILIPAFLGELALCLWLLVKGVDVEEWRRRVGAAPVHG